MEWNRGWEFRPQRKLGEMSRRRLGQCCRGFYKPSSSESHRHRVRQAVAMRCSARRIPNRRQPRLCRSCGRAPPASCVDVMPLDWTALGGAERTSELASQAGAGEVPGFRRVPAPLIRKGRRVMTSSPGRRSALSSRVRDGDKSTSDESIHYLH